MREVMIKVQGSSGVADLIYRIEWHENASFVITVHIPNLA